MRSFQHETFFIETSGVNEPRRGGRMPRIGSWRKDRLSSAEWIPLSQESALLLVNVRPDLVERAAGLAHLFEQGLQERTVSMLKRLVPEVPFHLVRRDVMDDPVEGGGIVR